MSINQVQRQKVRERAKNHCEYCKRPQRVIGMMFQIDHFKPQSLGGLDDLDNLAYACHDCNQFKSDRETCIDPISEKIVSLYNPRTQNWTEHFQWSKDKTELIGLTETARATIHCLQLNTELQREARSIWVQIGWQPPD